MVRAGRLPAALALSALMALPAGAQAPKSGATLDSLRPCRAAAPALPGGQQVLRAPLRAEFFPAGRQTIIESLPDSGRHALRGVRSLVIRTSTWDTRSEVKPSANVELRVAMSPRAGQNSRFILLLDGRSTDLGELRERALVDSTGRELGLWSVTARLTPAQFRSLIRASRVGIAAGRVQTTLTALEREGGRAVYVRAVCGG